MWVCLFILFSFSCSDMANTGINKVFWILNFESWRMGCQVTQIFAQHYVFMQHEANKFNHFTGVCSQSLSFCWMKHTFWQTGPHTFVQHSISGLVPGQRLFGQVLVRLCQAFHLSETSIESHCWVAGVLGHIQVSCPPQLLLYHQSLLQQLQERQTWQAGREKACFNLHSDITNPLILKLFQPSVAILIRGLP